MTAVSPPVTFAVNVIVWPSDAWSWHETRTVGHAIRGGETHPHMFTVTVVEVNATHPHPSTGQERVALPVTTVSTTASVGRWRPAPGDGLATVLP